MGQHPHRRIPPVTNEILICKGKEIVDNGKAYFIAKDKSDDRSQEVLDVAIQYLLNRTKRSESPQKKAVMEREGLYRLTLEDLREASA